MHIHIVATFVFCLLYQKGKKAKIHEDSNGNIYITGVTTRMVNSEEEVRIINFIAVAVACLTTIFCRP